MDKPQKVPAWAGRMQEWVLRQYQPRYDRWANCLASMAGNSARIGQELQAHKPLLDIWNEIGLDHIRQGVDNNKILKPRYLWPAAIAKKFGKAAQDTKNLSPQERAVAQRVSELAYDNAALLDTAIDCQHGYGYGFWTRGNFVADTMTELQKLATDPIALRGLTAGEAKAKFTDLSDTLSKEIHTFGKLIPSEARAVRAETSLAMQDMRAVKAAKNTDALLQHVPAATEERLAMRVAATVQRVEKAQERMPSHSRNRGWLVGSAMVGIGALAGWALLEQEKKSTWSERMKHDPALQQPPQRY